MTETPAGHNREGAVAAVAGRLLVDGNLVRGALLIAGGRIVDVRIGDVGKVGPLPSPRLDAEIVTPGLVDLQVNGGFGLEVGADGAALRALAARLPSTGVTTFLPTAVSGSAAEYRALAAAFATARDAGGARMPGLHLEGPLLSPARAGAHRVGEIAAANATLDDVLDDLLAARVVRLVTLAPERPGALALIHRLRQAGVAVSIGHTNATFEQAVAAIDAGATLATHLFNAMSPLQHRAPGAVGAALADDRVTAMLIADGVHVHPAALNIALRSKGADRIALVTDAIAAAGAPPGRYALAGVEVISDGQSARLADGTLAGSTLTLDRAVRMMAGVAGARLEDALAMASSVPAAVLGLADTGHIAVGQVADLALWSAAMEITATIVDGAIAFRSDPQ
ncbi:MAG TPA: N-acetylglucosamine-6-phosphate deacetylase [Polyangia bacterium]|nr:N-acetylglucosamine-6-phosphate deacetylase [Polyangia bacterium]